MKRKCPNCSSENRTDAKFCGYCGSRIPERYAIIQEEEIKNMATPNIDQMYDWHSIDELKALTGADDHLRFIEELLERTEMPTEARLQIRQQAQRIEQRLNDRNLYLAVIGEFSSGKSTFINALLRDDLLKTSDLVTTAAATKIKHGIELEVEVDFRDDSTFSVKGRGKSKEFTVISAPSRQERMQKRIMEVFNPIRRGGVKPSIQTIKSMWGLLREEGNPKPDWYSELEGVDVKQFIHAITSEDYIAQKVTDVTITHPAPFLADGIVIIDTPGTNPSAHTHHATITQQVVEEEADAAIIMVPATQALSQTLLGFLSVYLQPYLHRCIFVITQMDRIRPKEQDGMIEFVKRGVINQFGIESPKVYPSAAQIVIDDLMGEEVSQSKQVWKTQFFELERTIFNHLRQERALSIGENVLRLLTEFLENIEDHLETQWKEYKRRQTEIKREVIPDLPAFASQERASCHRMFQEAISTTMLQVEHCVEKHQVETISKVKKAIWEADNEQELKAILDNTVPSILTDHQRALKDELSRYSSLISQAAEEVSQNFDQKFEEAYRRLERLGGQVKVNQHEISHIELNIDQVLSSASSLNQDIDNKNSDAFKMMRIGMIGGTVFMPGIGTIIGGLIGGVLSVFFMISLEERKQKVWEKLHPKLEEYFNTLEEQVQQSSSLYVQHIMAALDQRIDAYIKRYKVVVERIVNEQQAEKQRLTKLQERTQTDLWEIERRQGAVSAQRERLAQVSINNL